MTNDGQKVEFENDRVRVVRVKINGREKHPLRTRGNRVLVWLTDSHVIRTEPNGRGEERQRKAGEVAWRDASQHRVENLRNEATELIIVELKD